MSRRPLETPENTNNVVRWPSVDPSVSGTFRAPKNIETLAAAERAANRVAPLWPLDRFVAVNPFIGLTEQRFEDAVLELARRGQGDLLMPAEFYIGQLESREISNDDLNEAATLNGFAGWTGDRSVLVEKLEANVAVASATVPTFAASLRTADNLDATALTIEQISEFAGAYFDEGQARWAAPWRDQPLYCAWRAEAVVNSTPEIYGVAKWRRIACALPSSSAELITIAVHELDIDVDDLDVYFDRLLADISGWAGHARYLDWHNDSPKHVVELLAVRLAWELVLHRVFGSTAVHREWLAQRRLFSEAPTTVAAEAVALRYFAHTAWEIARRRTMLNASAGRLRLRTPERITSLAERRPDIQAVFSFDVRSERMRRALELIDDGISTYGCAGFFGIPLEVLSADDATSSSRCPVLIEPQFTVREASADRDEAEKLRQRRLVGGAWQSFHAAAVASFTYVESLGFSYLYRLIRDSFGNAPGRNPSAEAPEVIEDSLLGTSAVGIGIDERVELAKAALQGMSLTKQFADVVVLVGHGSSSANNPYASRFNCAACGGHTGDTNARVAAAILNDPEVRALLNDEGIAIPVRTRFIAGIHDTTTDAVRLFGANELDAFHAPLLERLECALLAAATTVRRARAADYRLHEEICETDLVKRSRDWSEVRPEWGLAGCHSFIAAPRSRTRQTDLHGRSFLHSYDWKQDGSFDVLESILTGPLVVASWISLQYFASTVDNARYGSGDKTLHNIVGGIGVLEGTGGDLQVGLPWQAIHDGDQLLHEPLRLNALIAAPAEAITGILMKHEGVRQLVDNGWVHMYALQDDGRARRYLGDYQWSPALEGPAWQLDYDDVTEDERRYG
ncbi:MAG: DUF2309 domain-containing protein [Pseudomonadota bacterium]